MNTHTHILRHQAFMMEMGGKRNDTQQSRASEKKKRKNFRKVCGTAGKKNKSQMSLQQ